MTDATKRPAVRLSLLGAALLLCLLLTSATGGAQEAAGTYTNPVSKGFADTFADPSIIKAKDGYWYSYGTSDPLREGEGKTHVIPMSRSKDLVNWEYVGDAFGSGNRPSWAAPDAGIWAPDIRYLDGKYYMYYVVTQTTVTPERDDNAVGVATAPTPTGPWKDSGEPVVGPRRGNGGFLWTFDPNEFTDSDGKRYLYYGSYNGGMYVTELSPDGTRAVGPETMVAIDNRYEGAYVVKREGYYYLFGSSANCCAGPTTGYSVYVGRSKSPRGPFLDKEGQSMTESRVGGSIVVTPNGNKWIGPGHNAVVTDLSGEDFFVYHAIARSDPYLDEPYGVNERPMLIDRLDWVDSWPTVRGGRWASERAQPAPVTDGPVNDSFNRNTSLGTDWRSDGGGWRLVKETDGQGFVRQQGASPKETFLANRAPVPRDLRAEADLRLAGGTAAGVVVRYQDPNNYAAAWLDRTANALVTDVVAQGRRSRETSPLPVGFAFDRWHNVAAEVRGTEMTAEVTDARLHDPYVVAARTLPASLSEGGMGVAARGRADADNASAAGLYTPGTRTAPTPEVGSVAPEYSDEFDGAALEPDWRWVRSPDGQVAGGSFNWPTQAADIVGGGNDASLVLRDAPEGRYGGMLIGPPADTTWLRLAHRIDPANGEHEFRAATSRDGENFVWGGTWTLPAGTEPRIGLLSLGKAPNDPAATSRFDYFRVYTP